jgi:uncharacterized protein (DUF58 family)
MRIAEFSKRPYFNFIEKRSGPFDGSVTLTRDRVYIVPTKAGLIFSVLLLVLLVGSINYEKSLGFVLTFLLVGIGNVCLLATWRNLAGLNLTRGNASSAFVDESIGFDVQLNNRNSINRYAIAISYDGTEYDVVDCLSNSNQLISFRYKTEKRGIINPGKFKLYTEFPTGLFVAWTWIDLGMSSIVYPKPDKKTLSLFDKNVISGEIDNQGKSYDNFSHLRKYQRGDSVSHISWKASAKTDEIYTKEFQGAQLETLWIDWFDIDARNDEHRLSIMSAFIINAESHHQPYGLKLPDKTISPNNGNQHYHRCMTALALF